MALQPHQQAATYKLLNATVLDRLNAQRTAIESIETKGTLLLGFDVTAAGIYLTASGVDGWLKTAALATFALSAAFGVMVVRPTSTNFHPTRPSS